MIQTTEPNKLYNYNQILDIPFLKVGAKVGNTFEMVKNNRIKK